jgi:hypothetical protein
MVVNDDVIRMWTQIIVVSIKVPSQHCLEKLRKTTKILRMAGSSGRYSNLRLPEYELKLQSFNREVRCVQLTLVTLFLRLRKSFEIIEQKFEGWEPVKAEQGVEKIN